MAFWIALFALFFFFRLSLAIPSPHFGHPFAYEPASEPVASPNGFLRRPSGTNVPTTPRQPTFPASSTAPPTLNASRSAPENDVFATIQSQVMKRPVFIVGEVHSRLGHAQTMDLCRYLNTAIGKYAVGMAGAEDAENGIARQFETDAYVAKILTKFQSEPAVDLVSPDKNLGVTGQTSSTPANYEPFGSSFEGSLPDDPFGTGNYENVDSMENNFPVASGLASGNVVRVPFPSGPTPRRPSRDVARSTDGAQLGSSLPKSYVSDPMSIDGQNEEYTRPSGKQFMPPFCLLEGHTTQGTESYQSRALHFLLNSMADILESKSNDAFDRVDVMAVVGEFLGMVTLSSGKTSDFEHVRRRLDPAWVEILRKLADNEGLGPNAYFITSLNKEEFETKSLRALFEYENERIIKESKTAFAGQFKRNPKNFFNIDGSHHFYNRGTSRIGYFKNRAVLNVYTKIFDAVLQSMVDTHVNKPFESNIAYIIRRKSLKTTFRNTLNSLSQQFDDFVTTWVNAPDLSAVSANATLVMAKFRAQQSILAIRDMEMASSVDYWNFRIASFENTQAFQMGSLPIMLIVGDDHVTRIMTYLDTIYKDVVDDVVDIAPKSQPRLMTLLSAYFDRPSASDRENMHHRIPHLVGAEILPFRFERHITFGTPYYEADSWSDNILVEHFNRESRGLPVDLMKRIISYLMKLSDEDVRSKEDWAKLFGLNRNTALVSPRFASWSSATLNTIDGDMISHTKQPLFLVAMSDYSEWTPNTEGCAYYIRQLLAETNKSSSVDVDNARETNNICYIDAYWMSYQGGVPVINATQPTSNFIGIATPVSEGLTSSMKLLEECGSLPETNNRPISKHDVQRIEGQIVEIVYMVWRSWFLEEMKFITTDFAEKYSTINLYAGAFFHNASLVNVKPEHIIRAFEMYSKTFISEYTTKAHKDFGGEMTRESILRDLFDLDVATKLKQSPSFKSMVNILMYSSRYTYFDTKDNYVLRIRTCALATEFANIFLNNVFRFLNFETSRIRIPGLEAFNYVHSVLSPVFASKSYKEIYEWSREAVSTPLFASIMNVVHDLKDVYHARAIYDSLSEVIVSRRDDKLFTGRIGNVVYVNAERVAYLQKMLSLLEFDVKVKN